MQKRTLPLYHHQFRRSQPSFRNRIFVLMLFSILIFAVIVVRLFQLQVMRHEEYNAIAESQHFGATELPAKRGEIWVQDKRSGEFSKLATNTTLDLVYVDPLIAEEKEKIALNLAPLLYTQEDYEACIETPDECAYEIEKEAPDDPPNEEENRLWELNLGENTEGSLEDIFNLEEEQEEEIESIDPKSYEQMIDEVSKDFLKRISKEEVDFAVLKRDVEQEVIDQVLSQNLPGISVNEKNFIVYADPTMIPEGQVSYVAKNLSSILDEPTATLEAQLARRKVRYVFLKNRISPETSKQIKALNLKGVVLLPEHWRFYPENTLAANLIGFINRDNEGQYGIEAYFEEELKGDKGTIYAKSDPFGGQIATEEGEIIKAVDGDTIILTIDRVVQQKVEEILSAAVEEYRADSGQIIIMEPFSGAVVAMANYPTFDPNDFGESYTLREIEEGEELYKTVPMFKKDEKGRYMPYTPPEEESEEDQEENENSQEEQEDQRDSEEDQIYVYENLFGPGVFKNKTISEFYEPGSIFKPIIMAAALDAKEVVPEDTFNDDGPLKIDNFPIRNSDNEYHGITNMVEVLEKSLNTGMVFISKKLGMKLMHDYLQDFGLGEYTNIRLADETNQPVTYYKQWSRAQQFNIAFGQGIVVTPLQVLTAWAALANGGKLVQPYIVDKMVHEGDWLENEPQVIGRAISEEASQMISAMLVSSVNNGHGEPAGVEGYKIAGKTGTAQIAAPGGGWETGEGSTYTSFAGYFPAMDPEFVMLVKFDRPRMGENNTWGSTTAAPVFGEIAEFLIEYYNIEPS